MTVQLEVVEEPAPACAQVMVDAASGGGDLVLAGGSTPRAAYGDFVEIVQAGGIDLAETTLWFGDERCVPPDDERSNSRMVKDSLLGPLGRAAPREVHRIKGELGPEAGANDYERQLQDAGSPQFDLVLLGIGSDGHTASLFPDQDTLSERSRSVVGVHEAGLEPFVPRVTLTLPALGAARHVVFLISGASKAEAVAAAFGPAAKPHPHVPASMLVPFAKRITVLLDPAAAEQV